MAIYVQCPRDVRAKCEGELEYRVESDSDDYRTWQYAEFVKQWCDCRLTPEEEAAAQEEADKKAAEWVPSEP